ncbi:MAG: hypothetical protein AB4206_03425 [Xenococcaceae cyanobacterium]
MLSTNRTSVRFQSRILPLGSHPRDKGNFSPPSPEGTLCAFRPAQGRKDLVFYATHLTLMEHKLSFQLRIKVRTQPDWLLN